MASDNPNRDRLLQLIKDHKAIVAVVGLGYVGLPLAVGFARVGFKVTGFEVDSSRSERINRGENYIGDVNSADLKRLVKEGKLSASTDPAILGKSDVIIICVPTPLGKTGDPDVSMMVSARDRIKAHLHSGQLIILESTSYPGTLQELILPTFLEGGLKVGSDFFIAFSPERVDPSNPVYHVENTPKVVGGVTPACTEITSAFYSQIVERVVPVSSPAAAEMTKLLENTFRSINIGLANEVAIMCRILGLDVWEVISAASTKPFGFMPFYPGPGLGGHCIPVDPSYLSWKLRALKYRTRFIDLATEINTAMPEYVVRQAMIALNGKRKSINGSKVLVLGIAYKKDIDDLRESPALDVIRLLESYGATVAYHDPHIPELHEGEHRSKSVELTPVTLKEQDLVIIVTDHSSVDYDAVCRHSGLVYDTRNATRNVRASTATIVKL